MNHVDDRQIFEFLHPSMRERYEGSQCSRTGCLGPSGENLYTVPVEYCASDIHSLNFTLRLRVLSVSPGPICQLPYKVSVAIYCSMDQITRIVL